jgi:hypothetical protein
MWYVFSQNSSGGSFDIDNKVGIGSRVWIEANGKDEANERALSIGIYFDGVNVGYDCPCCGDRWYGICSDSYGYKKPEISEHHDFRMVDAVYLHPLNKPFVRAYKYNYRQIVDELVSQG